jgi:uncharacterized protein (DUF302 family)
MASFTVWLAARLENKRWKAGFRIALEVDQSEVAANILSAIVDNALTDMCYVVMRKLSSKSGRAFRY